jgi:hypothetical protein
MHTELPARIAALPRDDKGRPVPSFVQWINGKPDFRVINPHHLINAIRNDLCWVCGGKLGIHKVFVIGPMCAINRTSSEPPCHLECARFSAKACPFLTTPRMHRNEKGLPQDYTMAGIGLKRNPGVAMLWGTKSYRIFRDPSDGILFRIGEPYRVECYTEGRPSTYAEVYHSVQTGLPFLIELAREDGPPAIRELTRLTEVFLKFLPSETQAGDPPAGELVRLVAQG